MYTHDVIRAGQACSAYTGSDFACTGGSVRDVHGTCSGVQCMASDFGDGTSWWLTLGVMAHVWAIGDAAWNTQLNSIISETFAADPAPGFANLKLWQSAMTGAAFFYNDSLAGADKLYIMLAMLGLGCLGLLNLHFNAGRKKRSASPKLPDVMSESQTANETGADAL